MREINPEMGKRVNIANKLAIYFRKEANRDYEPNITK